MYQRNWFLTDFPAVTRCGVRNIWAVFYETLLHSDDEAVFFRRLKFWETITSVSRMLDVANGNQVITEGDDPWHGRIHWLCIPGTSVLTSCVRPRSYHHWRHFNIICVHDSFFSHPPAPMVHLALFLHHSVRIWLFRSSAFSSWFIKFFLDSRFYWHETKKKDFVFHALCVITD